MKRLNPFYWIGRARKRFEDYIYESALRNFGEIKTEGTTEMTEKTQKLKPCPFCGSDDVEILLPYRKKDNSALIYCFGCDLRIKKNSTPEAIAAWSRRVDNE